MAPSWLLWQLMKHPIFLVLLGASLALQKYLPNPVFTFGCASLYLQRNTVFCVCFSNLSGYSLHLSLPFNDTMLLFSEGFKLFLLQTGLNSVHSLCVGWTQIVGRKSLNVASGNFSKAECTVWVCHRTLGSCGAVQGMFFSTNHNSNPCTDRIFPSYCLHYYFCPTASLPALYADW